MGTLNCDYSFYHCVSLVCGAFTFFCKWLPVTAIIVICIVSAWGLLSKFFIKAPLKRNLCFIIVVAGTAIWGYILIASDTVATPFLFLFALFMFLGPFALWMLPLIWKDSWIIPKQYQGTVRYSLVVIIVLSCITWFLFFPLHLNIRTAYHQGNLEKLIHEMDGQCTTDFKGIVKMIDLSEKKISQEFRLLINEVFSPAEFVSYVNLCASNADNDLVKNLLRANNRVVSLNIAFTQIEDSIVNSVLLSCCTNLRFIYISKGQITNYSIQKLQRHGVYVGVIYPPPHIIQ